VLFDRDGTLIVDSGYPRDPRLVALMPGARMAVRRIRQAGLAAGVVTNQSGVGRGLLTRQEVECVNARVEEMAGPFDTWAVCWHAPEEGCTCRKPAPGLVLEAATGLGVPPADCVVIGDIGADVKAAEAAGARAILVPTRNTRAKEVRAAPQVAPNLLSAVDLLLGGRC
jgi:histidinol-phosphate phosphatase family protein